MSARSGAPGRLIDELCDTFEAGWLSGTPVPLERVVLSAPAPVRAELFRELLAIEGEYRAKALQPITAAEAEARFAGLGPWTAELIREILAPTGSWGGPARPAPAPAASPRARNLIGQYELLRELGHGAHGTVYKARHTGLGWLVALKVLFPHRAQSAEGMERFRREMAALGHLRHRHVARATDAGTADGYHYLAMEFVDGVDLGRVLRRAARLAVPDACEAVRQAAEGLDYIGRHDMVHRDIKPSNLLLGRDGAVRVVDLGLVRWDRTILGEPFTLTGEVMGTTDFIAPEQARGSRDADIRADVYSLGCTLYALLAGDPPFAEIGVGNILEKFKAHNEAPVPPLAPRCPAAPPALEALLRRMLEKDPALRPQSPAEVAREIAPFCEGHALAALLPPAPPDPIDLPAPPQRMPQVAAADAPTNTLDPTASIATTVEQAAPRRRKTWAFPSLALLALAAGGVWLAVRPAPIPPERRAEAAPAPEAGAVPEAPMPRLLPQPHVFTPGVWCELLDRAPKVLAWQPRPAASWAAFDTADGRKNLSVTTSGTALFQFADLPDAPFDLEVTFYQTPWVGGVGVFARSRPLAGSRLYAVADGLVIERFANQQTPAEVAVERGKYNVSQAHVATPIGIKPGRVPYTGGSRHVLRLTVGSRELETLTLDGYKFPPLLLSLGRTEEPLAGAHGAVGVVVDGCSVVIQSVRVLVHKPQEKP